MHTIYAFYHITGKADLKDVPSLMNTRISVHSLIFTEYLPRGAFSQNWCVPDLPRAYRP